MLTVLDIILPIFVLIGAGFVLGRQGIFSANDIRVLGRFVIKLALPALMFNAIASQPIGAAIQLPYVLIYGLGTVALMVVLYTAFRRAGRYDHITATLATMGSTVSNNGYVGYPILLLAMPGIANQAFAQNLLVENIIFLPILFTMLELGHEDGANRAQIALRTLRRLGSEPLILSIVFGCAFSLLALKLPSAIDRPLHMLAAGASATALMVIGGTLAHLKPKGTRALAGYIVACKLILHPLVIASLIALSTAFGLAEMTPDMRAALILSCAMPPLGVFSVIAQVHGKQGFASATQLGATIGALFTLSALLYVLT
ncbi:AEC family transporter [Aliiruegeria sabulilitoris]|uniref:AEC family transporter n=1 Tax=Aliiruegeria sabulilitoris TaxID=1510458 RepID=UPI00083600F0|nr:AEC family transporter [Aliiruegeria sabulilitoris]NDR57701.1 AEC family transporter [Pseudoruegeria sp. M32A2M]